MSDKMSFLNKLLDGVEWSGGHWVLLRTLGQEARIVMMNVKKEFILFMFVQEIF